jgi:hypothetical protein
MASLDQPLGAHLACLERPLLPNARARRDWWRNRHVHAHAYHGWLAAGWRVASVDLAGQRVTFRTG